MGQKQYFCTLNYDIHHNDVFQFLSVYVGMILRNVMNMGNVLVSTHLSINRKELILERNPLNMLTCLKSSTWVLISLNRWEGTLARGPVTAGTVG